VSYDRIIQAGRPPLDESSAWIGFSRFSKGSISISFFIKTSGSTSSTGAGSECLTFPYFKILGSWCTHMPISAMATVVGLTSSPSSGALTSISLSLVSSVNLYWPLKVNVVEDEILAI